MRANSAARSASEGVVLGDDLALLVVHEAADDLPGDDHAGDAE